jgi:hypothetical protein
MNLDVVLKIATPILIELKQNINKNTNPAEKAHRT